MQRQPVESSQIKSVGYDPATQTLELEFVQGGSVYRYSNFTPEDYDKLMAADSIGSHFFKNIKQRSDKHPYRRMEAEPTAEPTDPKN